MSILSDMKSIDPLSGYWITTKDCFTDYDTKVLVDLYQPLIGSTAIGLYLLLWNKLPENVLISERKNHSQLLGLMGIDAHEFYNARIYLEGVALLRTFKAEDSLGSYLVYDLMEPLRPDKFFSDSILSTFLYEKIGQRDFSGLKKKYLQTKRINNSNLTEVTKNFLDVFHLSNTEVEKISNNSQVQPKSTVNEPTYSQKQLSTFDWNLLEQIASKYQIDKNDIIQHQAEIFNVHIFYGVSEIEMADLIANTLDVNKNRIDMKRLQNVAQDRFEDRVNVSTRKNASASGSKPREDLSQFSDSEKALIKRAENSSPAEFLKNKKNSKGGFVGTAETKVLRKLQERGVLPIPVINILVDYILDNSASLSRSYVEHVANDWAQNGVQTAAQAVTRVKEFASGNIPDNKPSKRSYRRKSKTVEQATDWSQHETKDLDPDTVKQLNERLKNIHDKS